MLFNSSLIDWFIDQIEVVISIETGLVVIGFRRRRKAKTITFLLEGKEITMLTLTETQKATLTLAIKDAKGRPAKVDGVPVWNSSDVNVAIVTDISTDGLSAVVKAAGPGICQVTATVDADLGTGVKEITGFLDVNVSGGEAVTVELTAGPVTEQ
jgi:hypothetical protein